MDSFLPLIGSHFEKMAGALVDPAQPMWPSVVDTRDGRCPGEAAPPRRVYRLIGAPRGSSLYWDQPLLVAADAFSALSGDGRPAAAAAAYVGAFLECCVGEAGMFQWGNHVYYDLFEKKIVAFPAIHELRPLTPAWDFFRAAAPETTARYIGLMARRHVYDPASGGFNRHDDGRRGHAFLEAGGVLVESLAWLYAWKKADAALDLARRIAGYSFARRDRETGLVPNEPDKGRWDARVSTSECGLWGQCLLAAGELAGVAGFATMAAAAVSAYLRHAWDEPTEQYYGQVSVRGGEPVVPGAAGYWPGKYADPWNTGQWPHHDYPASLAEACLTLHRLTGEPFFAVAARRWARIIFAGRPGGDRRWAYAENYGRAIHFLARAGRELADDDLLAQAAVVAGEAVDRLYEGGMFQGYPGAHRHEAVDGAGYLFLALMALENGREPARCAFRF